MPGKASQLRLSHDDVDIEVLLAQKKRDYWAIQNESFMSWGTRIASELGATFKIRGNEAIFAPRNANDSVSGLSQLTVPHPNLCNGTILLPSEY